MTHGGWEDRLAAQALGVGGLSSGFEFSLAGIFSAQRLIWVFVLRAF